MKWDDENHTPSSHNLSAGGASGNRGAQRKDHQNSEYLPLYLYCRRLLFFFEFCDHSRDDVVRRPRFKDQRALVRLHFELLNLDLHFCYDVLPLIPLIRGQIRRNT